MNKINNKGGKMKEMYYDEIKKELESRRYFSRAVDRILRAIREEKSSSCLAWREYENMGFEGIVETITSLNHNPVENRLDVFVDGEIVETFNLCILYKCSFRNPVETRKEEDFFSREEHGKIIKGK